MKIRYAITKVQQDGIRVLAFANQGRNHHDTKESADKALAATLANNSESVLKSVYGDVTKMRVDSVECYDHGDAMKTVFPSKMYVARFKGRTVGAIGIRYGIKDAAFGENEEEARLSLYDRFEHISNLTLEEVS